MGRGGRGNALQVCADSAMACSAAGAVLEQTGRDFTLMFVATALVELGGVIAWMRWWRSERLFD